MTDSLKQQAWDMMRRRKDDIIRIANDGPSATHYDLRLIEAVFSLVAGDILKEEESDEIKGDTNDT